jgi:hypothetical protein
MDLYLNSRHPTKQQRLTNLTLCIGSLELHSSARRVLSSDGKWRACYRSNQ